MMEIKINKFIFQPKASFYINDFVHRQWSVKHITSCTSSWRTPSYWQCYTVVRSRYQNWPYSLFVHWRLTSELLLLELVNI